MEKVMAWCCYRQRFWRFWTQHWAQVRSVGGDCVPWKVYESGGRWGWHLYSHRETWRGTLNRWAEGAADKEVLQEISSEEKVEPEEMISTSEIKDILAMWEKLSSFTEKKHPKKVSTGCASSLLNETWLTQFHNSLKGRQKQRSLDSIFFKRLTSGSPENTEKKKSEDNCKMYSFVLSEVYS